MNEERGSWLKGLEYLGWFILGISLFCLIQIKVSSTNPCSNFSSQPELCSSDGPMGYED